MRSSGTIEGGQEGQSDFRDYTIRFCSTLEPRNAFSTNYIRITRQGRKPRKEQGVLHRFKSGDALTWLVTEK